MNTPLRLHAFFLIFTSLFGSFAAARPARAAPTALAEIRAVLASQASAWNRGEIDGYMAGYAKANATRFISGDTVTRGWQTVRDRYAKKYNSREKMGTLTFSDLEITVLSPDAALALGRWQLLRKADRPHGRFTLLFRRGPAGWRIVHDHTSSASP